MAGRKRATMLETKRGDRRREGEETERRREGGRGGKI